MISSAARAAREAKTKPSRRWIRPARASRARLSDAATGSPITRAISSTDYGRCASLPSSASRTAPSASASFSCWFCIGTSFNGPRRTPIAPGTSRQGTESKGSTTACGSCRSFRCASSSHEWRHALVAHSQARRPAVAAIASMPVSAGRPRARGRPDHGRGQPHRARQDESKLDYASEHPGRSQSRSGRPSGHDRAHALLAARVGPTRPDGIRRCRPVRRSGRVDGAWLRR
jgi:hypothetical protein